MRFTRGQRLIFREGDQDRYGYVIFERYETGNYWKLDGTPYRCDCVVRHSRGHRLALPTMSKGLWPLGRCVLTETA